MAEYITEEELKDAEVQSASAGQLLSRVTEDISTLIRQEVELAKAELKVEAAKAGKGAGLLTGAGLGVHFFLFFLSLTGVYALGDLLDHAGWGAFIVTLIWGVVALVLFLQGKKEIQTVHAPRQTIETIKEIV